MRLGTTYICVEDMEKSLNFYKLLLQKEPLYCNDDRWIEIHFNQAYIDDFFKEDEYKKNNIVIFNFEVEDLKSEYQRINQLGIGKVSEIMYVNVHMPYYYFNVIDPDGNILEITGNY